MPRREEPKFEKPKIPRAFWERQPEETDMAWEAFRKHRDKDPSKRSLARLAEELGKDITQIDRWKQKYLWKARIEAYDIELDRIEFMERQEDAKRAAKRHANIARLFQNKVVEALQTLDPQEMTPNQMIHAFEVAAKIERLTLDKSTENHNITGASVGQDNGLTEAVFDNPELADAVFRAMESSGDGESKSGNPS